MLQRMATEHARRCMRGDLLLHAALWERCVSPHVKHMSATCFSVWPESMRIGACAAIYRRMSRWGTLCEFSHVKHMSATCCSAWPESMRIGA